ncbi:hypothetical protein ADILRU_1168 [Leifsonia rubra CMS 76R]|nr:hypothetical protein ADILRU_1168 [Leifsonia rubra CMS 76R]
MALARLSSAAAAAAASRKLRRFRFAMCAPATTLPDFRASALGSVTAQNGIPEFSEFP